MINIVLLGPPAVGKGTLAARLEQDFALKTLSAGELLRAEVKAGTDLGRQADDVIARGDLLPDDLVVAMIVKRMAQPDCANGVLFDGFPRTLGQAQALDAILASLGQPLTGVIELQADAATLTARFNKRVSSAIARGETPRKDDNLPAFQHRLGIYYNETVQAIPYYLKQGVLDQVDATRPLNDILHDVYSGLGVRGCRPVASPVPSQSPAQSPTPS